MSILDVGLIVILLLIALTVGHTQGLKEAHFDQERANIKLQQCQEVIAWKDRK